MSAELYSDCYPDKTSIDKMTSKLITFLLISVFLAGVTFAFNQPSYPKISEKLIFQRIDGSEQTMQELKGKPLLVTFWSPNCALCLQEVSQLNQLYAKYQGGEKFELLALSMYYDRPDWVIQSSANLNMQYPVYFDLQKKLSHAFGNIVATPTSFLLNASGEIIYQHAGRIEFDIIDQKLKQLIG